MQTENKDAVVHPTETMTSLLIWWYSTYMPFSGIQLYRHLGYYDFGYPPHWPHIFSLFSSHVSFTEVHLQQRGNFSGSTKDAG